MKKLIIFLLVVLFLGVGTAMCYENIIDFIGGEVPNYVNALVRCENNASCYNDLNMSYPQGYDMVTLDGNVTRVYLFEVEIETEQELSND